MPYHDPYSDPGLVLLYISSLALKMDFRILRNFFKSEKGLKVEWMTKKLGFKSLISIKKLKSYTSLNISDY